MLWLTRIFIIVSFLCCALVSNAQQSSFSPALKAKVDKTLSVFYEVDNLKLEDIQFNDELKPSSIEKLNGHFFRIKTQGEMKGYVYINQAPSLKNVFDYMVILNKDLSVEKAKVLIYREQHGRQIGTVRWLSQFKGLNIADRPQLGNGVDGIAGATISSKSMTLAVHDLLVALNDVKTKGLL